MRTSSLRSRTVKVMFVFAMSARLVAVEQPQRRRARAGAQLGEVDKRLVARDDGLVVDAPQVLAHQRVRR